MAKTLHSLRHCDDCGSTHLGAPCGLSWLERMRSTRLDGSVTATRTKKDYFDDGPLKDVWGLDKHERKEQMLEETGGHGFIDSPADLTPEAAKHFGLADD